MRLAITLSMFLFLSVGCSRTKAQSADEAARDFARQIPGATGHQCTDSDSDGDGYCSCTIFRGNDEPLPIQCGCERLCVANCARGCKYVPTMKVAQ